MDSASGFWTGSPLPPLPMRIIRHAVPVQSVCQNASKSIARTALPMVRFGNEFV
jgi:hypothetical protein